MQYAIYGEPQGNNTFTNRFDVILMDLVKIMLFMEPWAHNECMESGLHSQFTVQGNTHNSHPLSSAYFPTPTGALNASIPNGPQNMGYCKWASKYGIL